MRSSLPLRLLPILALLLALEILAPASARADTPSFSDSVWSGGVGSSPSSAIPIVGIMRNQLYPGQSIWYQIAFTGAPPWSVTLNYNPGNTPPPGTFQMRVNWTTPNGAPFIDWPGYYRVGEGTRNGFAQGVLYWMSGDPGPATYAIEVVNNSTVPVGYAIAVTSHQYPPPVLDPPTPLEFLPPLEQGG